jgi:intein-encoded DNA endonuclease-like protein
VQYLVDDPDQQAAIATIRELRAAGASLRRISTEVQRRHGVRLSHEGVARVVAEG